jgi:ribonuclease G
MEELVRQDRTKCVAVGWTKLGLLEMTRKKVREPIDTSAAGICPHCMGTGKVPDRG